MTGSSNMLYEVFEAQTLNSTLAGESLRRAGHEIAALALARNLNVLAADQAGERLVGAALLADERVRPVDISCRLDDQSVLVVSGHVAGPTGLTQKAYSARALGAVHVEAAVLGTCCEGVGGYDDMTMIARSGRRLVAL